MSKLDKSDRLAAAREDKKLPWLPRKVVFEHFPRDSDPTYFSLVMLAAWARIDNPNLISEETIMKKVEPDPIAKLYDRLDEKLSIIIAEEEKKMQRSKR